MGLDLHAFLRPHKQDPSVHMAVEGDPFFLDLPQGSQAEHLESPAVGEDGPLPPHKLVQAAPAVNQLVSGTDVEVVGVAQLHLAL